MNSRNNPLINKIEASLEDRKCFKEAHAPALKQIADHVNQGSVLINMDLVHILLDIIDGSQRHDEELSRLIEREKNKNIPALERK